MIPLTEAEASVFNTPGDAIKHAYLEPFRFEWEERSSLLGTIMAVGTDASDFVRAITKESSTAIRIWKLGDENTSELIVEAPATLACWHGNYYYYTDGRTVYRNSDIIYTSDVDIASLAVVAYNEFYFHYVTSEGVSHFMHYDPVADEAIESDIYWAGTISTVGAARLEDHDVVVLSGELPHYVSASKETDKLTWKEEVNNGIVAFTVRDDVWSQHYNVEVNEFDTQNFERMSVFTTPNGKLGVVYTVSLYGVANTFVALSMDGRAWTLPIPVSHPGSLYRPFIAIDANYIYAVSMSEVYRSPNFRLFGGTPALFDITDIVLDCNVTIEQRSGVSMAVRKTDELSSYLDLGSVILTLYAGYIYSPDVVIEKLIFTGEIDTSGSQQDYVPNNVIMLQFRDITSFLDRTKSPITVEANGINSLLDNYAAATGTGFGGMSRTAAYKGSWKVESGVLKPLADGTSVAFNTTGNMVNGAISVLATVTDLSHDAVGVVYRGMADTMLMALMYYPALGQIVLERRNGSTASVVDSYTVNLGTTPKLRAEYKYGLHRGYYSDDGVEWTKVIEKLYKQHCYYGAAGLMAVQSIPSNVPDPWEPPTWDPPFVPPPIIELELGSSAVVAYYLEGVLAIFYCNDITVETPLWTNITSDLSATRITSIALLAGVFVSTEDAVYYCSNPLEPAWVSLAAPTGYSYFKGVGLRPLVQRSPDGTHVLVDVWSGNARYAWVLDSVLDTVSLTKVGVQGLRGSLHASWSGDACICAGHTNLKEGEGCNAIMVDEDSPPCSSGDCKIDTDNPNSRVGVRLGLDISTDGCWHYAVVSPEARIRGWNKASGISAISAGYEFLSVNNYAQVYCDGEWKTSCSATYVQQLDADSLGTAMIGTGTTVRVRGTGTMRVTALTARYHVYIEVLETQARICWSEVASEEYSVSPDPLYLQHLKVPLDYTGDLDELAIECCDSGEDINACPDWAVNIVKQPDGYRMIMDDGTNLIVGDDNDPCGSETSATADPVIDEANQGIDVITINGLNVALSRDNSELQISSDGFLTHSSVELPEYIGVACGGIGALMEHYVLVNGDTGIGVYDLTAEAWRDVTGDLDLDTSNVDSDYGHIAGVA